MKTCIPVTGNRKPYKTTDWKSAPFFILLDERGKELELYSQISLQSRVARTSLGDMIEEEEIGSIICTSIPAMTRKLFKDYGVEVTYSGAEDPFRAFQQLTAGQEESLPEGFEFRLSCSSDSCGSCESGSCK